MFYSPIDWQFLPSLCNITGAITEKKKLIVTLDPQRGWLEGNQLLNTLITLKQKKKKRMHNTFSKKKKFHNHFHNWRDDFKACLCYFLFFHYIVALQKLWKMFFISPKKLFLFSRYSNFCISILPSFFPVSHCSEDDQR